MSTNHCSMVFHDMIWSNTEDIQNYAITPRQRHLLWTESFTTTRSVLDMDWASGAFNKERMRREDEKVLRSGVRMLRTTSSPVPAYENVRMLRTTSSPVPASSLPPSTRALCASILPIHHIAVARAETICPAMHSQGFDVVGTHLACGISCDSSQQGQKVLFSHVELAATDRTL